MNEPLTLVATGVFMFLVFAGIGTMAGLMFWLMDGGIERVLE